MRVFLLVGLVWVMSCAKPGVDPATFATLAGEVRYRGPADQAVVIDMDQDPDCKKLYKDGKRSESLVVVGEDARLANAFVYLKGEGLEPKAIPAPPAVRIDQKGCWFEPRVIGLQVGQTLEVTNSDKVTHNIHPEAKANREWNQSQAPEDPALKRKFAQPEVMIRVKCNVHKWMRAWIGVVGHPYFAVTGADGRFELKDVPPGSYTLVAWHEKLGTRETKITIGPRASMVVAFDFNGQ